MFHTVGVYVIVLSDRLQAYEYRKLRTGVFIGIGSLALVPFSHGVLRYGASNSTFAHRSEGQSLTPVPLGSSGSKPACACRSAGLLSSSFASVSARSASESVSPRHSHFRA